jgi:phosphate transport system substrate-binding protein
MTEEVLMNNSIKISLILLITVLSLLTAGNPLYGEEGKITITGSTTVLPVAQRAAEAFMDIHEEVSISVRGGGSGVGIAALIDGRADIANASRSIKEKEIEIAEEKGVNPVAHVVARDGIAVVIHPDNPVNGLTITQLKKIYTGEINNWKDMGGQDKAIVVLSRDFSSGTFEVFKELVLGGNKVKDGALMLASNKAISTTVAKTPYAIGYIGLGYLSGEVKAIKIDGIIPSEQTVKNGDYNLARSLFMYTNGETTGVLKSFINFIFSEQGQNIAREVGYVPVK